MYHIGSGELTCGASARQNGWVIRHAGLIDELKSWRSVWGML